MANGKWAAVIGNGYNSTENDGPATTSATGHAVLYILFLEGGLDGAWTAGTDYIKLDTEMGDPDTPNGLATPAPVDLDGDFTADYVYAGDQRGNLWKFDVSDPDSTNWQVAYSSPLFTATAVDGTPQPITARPEAGLHPKDPNGLLVYFGTGKYLETGDKNVSGVSTQTFYAIWDKNLSTLSPFTRSALVQQEVIAVVSGHRITSDHPVDWANHRGWYLDLPTAGERQVSNPLLRNDRVIFSTLIPNTQICGTGGTGWLMELNAHSGSRLPFSPFDLNGDDEFDAKDMVTTPLVENEEPIPVSGLASIEGILSSPMVLSAGRTELKYRAST
jgi:type IV pilus assembly protein PilY1